MAAANVQHRTIKLVFQRAGGGACGDSKLKLLKKLNDSLK